LLSLPSIAGFDALEALVTGAASVVVVPDSGVPANKLVGIGHAAATAPPIRYRIASRREGLLGAPCPFEWFDLSLDPDTPLC